MTVETPKRKTNPYIASLFGLAFATSIGVLAILALVKQHEVDELQRQYDAAQKREAIYKQKTMWARDQFTVYADSIEEFGWFVNIDKKATARQFREHSAELQKRIDEAEAIK